MDGKHKPHERLHSPSSSTEDETTLDPSTSCADLRSPKESPRPSTNKNGESPRKDDCKVVAGEERKPCGIVSNQEATPSTSSKITKRTTPPNSDSTLPHNTAKCENACASDSSPPVTVSRVILNLEELTKDSNDTVAWRRDSCLVVRRHAAAMLAKCNVIADQVNMGDSDESVIIVPCPFCDSIECDGFTKHTFLEPEMNPEMESAFSSLPQDIITKVFSYLSPPEISHSVMPVCRQWRELGYDPDVRMSLSIDNTKSVTSPYLSFLLRGARKIKDLDLAHRTLSPVDVIVWSRHCRSLQSLDLSDCRFAPGDMVKVFETIVVNCPHLQKLNVKGVVEIDHNAVVTITCFRRLTDINFSGINLLDESINFFSENTSGLKKMNIDGIFGIDDDAIVALVMKNKDSLKELVLDGNELTDQSVRAISMCSHLKNLAMRFCLKLSDASLSVIKEMGQLRELKLKRGDKFSSNALTQLFINTQLKNLTELDLSHCSNLTDDGVAALVACCGCNLNSLSLMWCAKLTDISLEKIVDTCVEMRQMCLSGLDEMRGDCLRRIPCLHAASCSPESRWLRQHR